MAYEREYFSSDWSFKKQQLQFLRTHLLRNLDTLDIKFETLFQASLIWGPGKRLVLEWISKCLVPVEFKDMILFCENFSKLDLNMLCLSELHEFGDVILDAFMFTWRDSHPAYRGASSTPIHPKDAQVYHKR